MWITKLYAANGDVIKTYQHKKEPSFLSHGSVLLVRLDNGRTVYLVGTVIAEEK